MCAHALVQARTVCSHRPAEQVLFSALLQDFVSAVMDVDYSPTGREFVAGSYDRSVRIFGFNAGHSREVSDRVSRQSLISSQCGVAC